MADYWKSLPKKYCEFCKCWITDNKASRDFHERGFRHQANVRRRVKDIQRNSAIQERERQQYYNELLKIETAALKTFKDDIARNPSLSSEYSSTKSIASQITRTDFGKTSKSVTTNRFGEDFETYHESETLANGKKRALETIAKSFEKKSKWLEAKTSDGQSYYWNKESLETRHNPPKSGFLSLPEQEQLTKNVSTSSDSKSIEHFEVYRPDPYGGWKNVEKHDTTKMLDLQLPCQNISQIILDIGQTKQAEEKDSIEGKKPVVEFQERTMESINKRLVAKNENVSFKKKKTNINKNLRNRLED